MHQDPLLGASVLCGISQRKTGCPQCQQSIPPPRGMAPNHGRLVTEELLSDIDQLGSVVNSLVSTLMSAPLRHPASAKSPKTTVTAMRIHFMWFSFIDEGGGYQCQQAVHAVENAQRAMENSTDWSLKKSLCFWFLLTFLIYTM